MVVLGSGLTQLMEWIFQLREGSTTGRLALYKYSLQVFEGVDWILGFGLRPRDESAFLVPIGSHSTYLSMLFKTGVIGCSIFILFQAQLLMRWLRFRGIATRRRNLFCLWQGLGGVFTGVGLWMFTGDIDAPQLLAFLYFSLVGVFEALVREEKVMALKAAERRSRPVTQAA